MHEKPPTQTDTPDAKNTASHDTRSYTQPHTRPPGIGPNKRNERMPHERDESAHATGDRMNENPTPSDRQISQAQEDVEHGLVDTDRRGTPSDVPTGKKT